MTKKKMAFRCPECGYGGKGGKQHKARMEAPGLILPSTVMECGKCGHISEVVRGDGKAWFDAVEFERANKMSLVEWCDRHNRKMATEDEQ